MSDGYTLTGLSCHVNGRALIDGIDLSLPGGRMIGLVGHNGSGKSTLLKHLARQMPAGAQSTGTIRLDGRTLADWPRRALARRLAYLPQDPPPTDAMTVTELVRLGRYPWHGPFRAPGPADHAAVARAIAACGLQAHEARRVDALSGGEAQRAWIAMMVAQEADCLLLDEPISALDIAHQVEILRLLRTLTRDHGRSVILVLHDLNMAARFCDRIVALKGGARIFDGTPDAFMTREALHAIYGIDMQILSAQAGQGEAGQGEAGHADPTPCDTPRAHTAQDALRTCPVAVPR